MELFIMLKKLVVAFCAITLLAGCSGKKMSSGVDSALERDFVENVGDRVHFGFDKSNLTQESQDTLKRQAAWLEKHPKVRASVQGHTDVRGSREYNLGLGERRAHAARKFLEAQGVAGDRLETISFGKERPADLGTDENAHKLNRRSVTVLQ